MTLRCRGRWLMGKCPHQRRRSWFGGERVYWCLDPKRTGLLGSHVGAGDVDRGVIYRWRGSFSALEGGERERSTEVGGQA